MYYLLLVLVLFAETDCQSIFRRPEYYPQNVVSSILTPFIIKNECHTSADNRVGICMPKATCIGTGGIITGNCGLLSSCCIYQGSCKSIVTSNETYFVSPNYPEIQTSRFDPSMCIFTLQRNNLIQKLPICQIRIDFDEFSLAPPINGKCGDATDSFILSGAFNFNSSGLPNSGLCGELTGQHLYLDVDPDDTTEPLLFIINTSNEEVYNRKWSIRIRQIPCHSQYKAIPGCLQTYSGQEGIIESFNYRGIPRGLNVGGYPNNRPLVGFPINAGDSPNYFNNLNYGICIMLANGYCGIKYEATEFDFGGTQAGQSCIGSNAGLSNQCYCTIADSLEDEGDYLTIVGASNDGFTLLQNQFCGQKLNSRPNQKMNQPIISFYKPFVIFVHSDDRATSNMIDSVVSERPNQKGFQIKYTQNQMNYNPTYAVYAKYNVSQDVWQMHDIWIWNFLLKSFGQKKTFKYLQYRLESNQNMTPVYAFFVTVFAITWLITFYLRFNSLRRQFRHQNFKALLLQLFQQMNPNLNSVIERRFARGRRLLNRQNQNRANRPGNHDATSNRMNNRNSTHRTPRNRSNTPPDQQQLPNREAQNNT